jgi:hypothetical protein
MKSGASLYRSITAIAFQININFFIFSKASGNTDFKTNVTLKLSTD